MPEPTPESNADMDERAALAAIRELRLGAGHIRSAPRELGLPEPTIGYKADGAKPRLDLLPPDVLEGFAAVMTVGAKKYGDHNWRSGMRWGRHYAAALRHLFAWWRGEDLDPETGLPHLDHAMCCIAFLRHYAHGPRAKAYQQHDDRPGKVGGPENPTESRV
jgi:hypothetical protein